MTSKGRATYTLAKVKPTYRITQEDLQRDPYKYNGLIDSYGNMARLAQYMKLMFRYRRKLNSRLTPSKRRKYKKLHNVNMRLFEREIERLSADLDRYLARSLEHKVKVKQRFDRVAEVFRERLELRAVSGLWTGYAGT